MSPRPGDASQDTQPEEELDNNKLAIIYYETQVQYKHNTLVTGGKLMEPGLGTNPRSSGSGVGRGCRPVPRRPRIQGAVSEEERAKSESKSKASRWSRTSG
jgi:hypothetical protein